MKNITYILLFCGLILCNYEKSMAWDSTAAKFFPLAVGNSWSYHYISRGGNPIPCYPNNQYNYIISITSDTVVNGHRYYKFSNGDRLRIDSASMNVYRYYPNGECLFDSLLARKNDYIGGCGFQGSIGDSSYILFAGVNRKVRTTNGIGYSKKLMIGMGLYYHGGCELNSGFDQQLNGCIINGVQYGQMLGLNNISSELPAEFSLSQNYPNPFNPVTKIKFSITQNETIHRVVSTSLIVYDALGKEIAILFNQQLQRGTYEVDWDASAYPSGVYYYKLEVSPSTGSGRGFTETKKMVLIK